VHKSDNIRLKKRIYVEPFKVILFIRKIVIKKTLLKVFRLIIMEKNPMRVLKSFILE